MFNFQEIVEELSYRVKGAPNFKDNNHLSELVGILRESKWTEESITEFLRNLIDEKRKKRNPGTTWKTAKAWAGWKSGEPKARYGLKSAEIAQAYIDGKISDDELDKGKGDTEEKPTEETDEKKIESVIEKNTQQTPQTPEEQEAVDKKLSKRMEDDLDYITEDADKFLENSNKVGAGERTPTYAEVVHLKKFAEKRRDQNNARKEFLETNPSEEEIKLYDETTPLWIHPKTKAVQREISDEVLVESKQYLKDKMGEEKYKALNKKLANSGGWQRGGFKYNAEELKNRASELLRQYLKHGGRCSVTGEKVKLSEIEPDHRIPISKGADPERNKELDNPKNNIDMITSNVNQFKSSAEDDDLVHKTRKELYREDGGIRERKKREAAHKNARRAALEKKYLSDFKNDNLNLTKEDFDTMDEDEIKYLVEAHNKAKGMVAGTPEYKNRIIINVKQRFNPKTGTTGGGANRLSIKPERELVRKELRKRGYNIPSEEQINEEQRVVDDSRKLIRKQTIKDSIEILKYKIDNEKYSDSRINSLKVGAPDPEKVDLLTPERTKKKWKNELIAFEKQLEDLEGTTEESLDINEDLILEGDTSPTTFYHEVITGIIVAGGTGPFNTGEDVKKYFDNGTITAAKGGGKTSPVDVMKLKQARFLSKKSIPKSGTVSDAIKVGKEIVKVLGKGRNMKWTGPTNDKSDYGAGDIGATFGKGYGDVGVSLKAGKGQLKNLTINTFFKGLKLPQLTSDYFLSNFKSDWDAMTKDWITLAEKTFNDNINITDDTFPEQDDKNIFTKGKDDVPMHSEIIVKELFKKHLKSNWVDYQKETLTQGELDMFTASVGMKPITKDKKFRYFLYKLNQKYKFTGWNEKRDKHFDNIFGQFTNKYDSQIKDGLHNLFKRQLSVGKNSIFYAAKGGKTFWFIPSKKIYERDMPPEAFLSNYETRSGGSGYEFLLDVGVQTPKTGIPIGVVKIIFRFAQGQMNGMVTTKSDYTLMAKDWSGLLGNFRK